jgi:hypothetical protein
MGNPLSLPLLRQHVQVTILEIAQVLYTHQMNFSDSQKASLNEEWNVVIHLLQLAYKGEPFAFRQDPPLSRASNNQGLLNIINSTLFRVRALSDEIFVRTNMVTRFTRTIGYLNLVLLHCEQIKNLLRPLPRVTFDPVSPASFQENGDNYEQWVNLNDNGNVFQPAAQEVLQPAAQEVLQPVVEVEVTQPAAQEVPQPVVEVEVPQPVVEVEVTQQDTQPVAEVEVPQQDTQPVAEVEVPQQDTQPVAEVEVPEQDTQSAAEDEEPIPQEYFTSPSVVGGVRFPTTFRTSDWILSVPVKHHEEHREMQNNTLNVMTIVFSVIVLFYTWMITSVTQEPQIIFV